jgi:hypothetical protein
VRRGPADRGRRRRALIRISLLVVLALFAGNLAGIHAQQPNDAQRLDRGRVTVLFYPRDRRLAQTVLGRAAVDDSFPGLPKPRAHVVIAIAPDSRRFREWVGPGAPEWGAAVAFPQSNRIVIQGSSASSDAGDPLETLRHELAHLALHEQLGDLPPRWFDEGYASVAAHEWRREDMVAANLGLAWHGMPTLDQLEREFEGGSTGAQEAYALAYRAVLDLTELGGRDGLAPLFANWKRSRSLDAAVRLSYGITLSEFEQRWRDRTRRRYGGLALMGNLAVVGILVSFVLVPLYLARRRRDRRRLAAMMVADAAADAVAAADPLAAILAEPPGTTVVDEERVDPP